MDEIRFKLFHFIRFLETLQNNVTNYILLGNSKYSVLLKKRGCKKEPNHQRKISNIKQIIVTRIRKIQLLSEVCDKIQRIIELTWLNSEILRFVEGLSSFSSSSERVTPVCWFSLLRPLSFGHLGKKLIYHLHT